MDRGCEEAAEDIEAWLRYHAGEEDRRWRAQEWPDYPMPPCEDLPYDRDRHLPNRQE